MAATELSFVQQLIAERQVKLAARAHPVLSLLKVRSQIDLLAKPLVGDLKFSSFLDTYTDVHRYSFYASWVDLNADYTEGRCFVRSKQIAGNLRALMIREKIAFAQCSNHRCVGLNGKVSYKVQVMLSK